MENIILSSCNDRKTLSKNSNKLDNDTKVELLSVKSELLDIKKEPNSSSTNITSLLKNNIDGMELVNTDHKMLESTEKSILNIKKEKCLDIYRELDEQSMSKHDVKQEPIDPESPLELMEDNRDFDGTFSINNEEKFTENSLEFLEQNEGFDENPESEFKFTETNMFGISEMFNFISDEVIKCKYCNFETKHKNQLWGHMQIHNDSLDLKSQEVTLYKCPFPECNFQTVYKYSVSKHYNTHKTQKYKCSKCSYTTLQLKKYEQHIKSCEKLPEGTLLQCDKCDYKVKTQGLLLVHKRRHKDESRLLKCTGE